MSKAIVESLVYHHAGKAYESRLVYAPGAEAKPALLMAPNWMGIGEGAERIAREVAEKGYVVLIAAQEPDQTLLRTPQSARSGQRRQP